MQSRDFNIRGAVDIIVGSKYTESKRVSICLYLKWCCYLRKALSAVDCADFDHVIHPILELNGPMHVLMLRLQSSHLAPTVHDSIDYLIDGSWQHSCLTHKYKQIDEQIINLVQFKNQKKKKISRKIISLMHLRKHIRSCSLWIALMVGGVTVS